MDHFHSKDIFTYKSYAYMLVFIHQFSYVILEMYSLNNAKFVLHDQTLTVNRIVYQCADIELILLVAATNGRNVLKIYNGTVGK